MEEETKIPIYRIDDDHETRSNIFPRWSEELLEVDENITRIIDQKSTVEDVILNCLYKEKQKAREVHYKGIFNIINNVNQIESLDSKWKVGDYISRIYHLITLLYNRQTKLPMILLSNFKEVILYKEFYDRLFYGKYYEKHETQKESKDNVEHPKHYTSHPSKIECITITQYYNFCIGNAMKYLWRAGIKKEEGLTPVEKEIEDCKKAIWYINKHIESLK